MTRNMDATVASVLADEGGIADVGDGKGVTRFGQTPGWLEHWGLVPPSTAEQAATNYETVWARTGISEIIDRDMRLGYVLATFATHASERLAIVKLQEELKVTADGEIGPVTLAALDKADKNVVAHGLVAAYGEQLGVAMSNMTRDNRRNARGWSRRLGRLIRGLA